MNFLEKNLEDIIFETPNHLLNERGLPIKGRKLRQVRIGNYGIADLITYQHISEIDENGILIPSLKICIYEFKKDEVNENTLMQCLRYAKGITRFFQLKTIDYYVEYEFVLCGSNIKTSNEFIYFTDFMDNLKIYTYDYEYNGIIFNREHGYCLTNENFA